MKEISSNLIRYKTIEHERTEDAPFMGALISAIDCRFDCPHCFNQNVKKIKTQLDTIENIIKEIKNNIFNEGIIFGGLEWTLQKEECLALASAASSSGLKTILYTGHDFEDNELKDFINSGFFDYIKCGRFIEEKRAYNNYEYGVLLASTNQKIYKKGIDY